MGCQNESCVLSVHETNVNAALREVLEQGVSLNSVPIVLNEATIGEVEFYQPEHPSESGSLVTRILGSFTWNGALIEGHPVRFVETCAKEVCSCLVG